ncbi:MAG: hypothetical protein C0469_03875 [Cyanobacteria bacterium DS2.3.42]|nr:hypothetical protein [Cyanobacteria bacterium DS2.3.42]
MSYHSSIAKPQGSSDLLAREENTQAADYFRFSGDEWAAANARRQAKLTPQEVDLEIVDNSGSDKFEFAEDDLRHAKSTAARLTALEKIAASGVDKFKFEDKDGVEREFRVETNKCGDKTLIHCYGKDSHGHEQVVMRFARNASGELEAERNKDGKPVSYYGDNWSRTMQGKSFLIGEKRNESREADNHGNRERARESEKSKEKDRNRSGERDRERERDRGSEKDRGREKDCDRERTQRSRSKETCEDGDDRRRPRLDIGQKLAEVAMVAAPFLMAQLSNRDRCNDNYPYRDYPRHMSERGCRNYYDDNHHQSNYYQGHDNDRKIFFDVRNNNGWSSHNRGGHGHNRHSNYRSHQNRGNCR